MERQWSIPPKLRTYIAGGILLAGAIGANLFPEQVHTVGRRIFPDVECQQDNKKEIGIYRIDALPDHNPLIRTGPNINAKEIGFLAPGTPVFARKVWGGTFPTNNKSFIKTEKSGKRCGLWFEVSPINGEIQVYWVDGRGNYIPQINVNGQIVTIKSGYVGGNFMESVVDDISSITK